MCMQRQQQRKHEPNYFETSFSQKVQADTFKPPVHEARSEHESLEPEFCERCSVLVKTGHSIDRSTSPGQKSSPEHPKGSPATILLVDDNEINVRLLVAFVEKLGYNYLIARNGQEALDSFKEHADKICVILMGKLLTLSSLPAFNLTPSIDISMPVMDGIEATRRIREHENTLDSKQRAMIVAITGVAQAEVERDAIESGMDTFLTKPIRLDIVGPMIKRKIHELSLI